MRSFSLVVLTFFMMALGTAWGGVSLHSLWDTSAFILIFGSLSVYLTIAIGPKNFLSLMDRVTHRNLSEKDVAILERISSLGFLFGTVSVIVGFIHVLQNLADTQNLGAGIETAFVGLVCGSVPAILITLVTGISLKRARHSRTYLGSTAVVTLVFMGLTLYARS